MIYDDLGIARYSAIDKAVRIGKYRKLLFIDCGNGFDPYQVLKLSKNNQQAKKVLRNTMVSRPFTFYQLNSLVYYNLLPSCLEHKANDVIIFGLNTLFADESRDEEEKEAILTAISKKLIHLDEENELNIHFFLSRDKYTDLFLGVLHGKDRTIVSPSH